MTLAVLSVLAFEAFCSSWLSPAAILPDLALGLSAWAAFNARQRGVPFALAAGAAAAVFDAGPWALAPFSCLALLLLLRRLRRTWAPRNGSARFAAAASVLLLVLIADFCLRYAAGEAVSVLQQGTRWAATCLCLPLLFSWRGRGGPRGSRR